MLFGWFVLCSLAAIACAIFDRLRRKIGSLTVLLAGSCPWIVVWALDDGSKFAAENNFIGVTVGLAGVFGSTVFSILAAILLLAKRRVVDERGLFISCILSVVFGFASTAQIMRILDALGSV